MTGFMGRSTAVIQMISNIIARVAFKTGGAGRTDFGSWFGAQAGNRHAGDHLVAFLQTRQHFGVNVVSDAGLDLARLQFGVLARGIFDQHIDGVN